MRLATLSEGLDEQSVARLVDLATILKTIGEDDAQDKDAQINFKTFQGYRQAQATPAKEPTQPPAKHKVKASASLL
jgi:hypothetical protein